MTQEFKERYEYSLDSRQLGIVVLAVGVLAALVFVIGVSVGIQWQKRTAGVQTPSGDMTGTENATDQEEPPGNGLPVAPAVEPGYNEPDDKTGSNDIIKDADEKNNGNSTGGLTFPETLAAMEPAAVKPKPKPKSEAKPAQLDKENQNKAAGKSDGIYTVQVGAFKESESAKRLVDRLKKEGFEAEYRRADGAAGLYKVRVGSFASLADARGIAAKLESKEGLKPYVTSY